MARVLERHAARVLSLFASLRPGERDTLLDFLKRVELHWEELAAMPLRSLNGSRVSARRRRFTADA